ncbi:MAG: carboxypeptidase regulatory-like domain-containing protein, partial [Terracidiphilus sp.]
MAGLARDWAKTLAVAVLFLSAGTRFYAQSAQTLPDSSTPTNATGALAGRLTDLHSNPLEDVTVVLRNQATGAEAARATTVKSGAFLFTGLEPGEYALEAESARLGHGRVESIVVNAGHEAQVQAAMEFEPLASSPVLAATPREERPKVEERPRINRPVLERETVGVSDAASALKPLQTLPLPGRSVRAKIPPVTTLAVDVPLAPEPLQTLTLTGRSLRESTPPASTVTTPAVANGSKVLASRPWAPTPLNSPVSPASSTTMSAVELQALPVAGRRWQDFVLDNTPTSATPAGGQGQIALRGAGQQPAEIAIDGVSQDLAFGSTRGTNGSGQGSSGHGVLGQGGDGPAGIAQVGAGGHGMAVSEAAIRSLQTAAGNVEAAESRSAGGRMNVESQRGANELHGQGFFFDRQNTWGARNPFTQWITETSESEPFAPDNAVQFPVFDNGYGSIQSGSPELYTPPDHETVWGIGLGSRIRRDKLFWFAALDSYNRNDPAVSMVKHPYLAQYLSGCVITPENPCVETTGFFAQPSNDQLEVLCARLGLTETVQGQMEVCPNPLVEALVPYSNMLETLGGLLGPAPRTATQWTGFGRVDWQAAERHRFTIEAIGTHWNSPGGGLTRVSETYGNHSFGSSEASEKWLLGRWEAFLTPNVLAVTQASAGAVNLEARPETPSAYEQTFLTGNAYGQLPEIVVDNRYGFTIGNPSRFGQGSYPDERLYYGQESLDWIRGKLLVKAGFSVSHNSDATSLLRNRTGTYTYANVENFASDALVFAKYGGNDALDPFNQHNCDQTGKVWRDSSGGLEGLGNLPCYSYYSQTIGPNVWQLSTTDWAGFATAQWQANKQVVLSVGLRWEREQRPPPLAALNNPKLPLTETLPALGNNWGPRIGLAVGTGEKHWPVLRLGYGIYYGRTENATLEMALTQTGSLNGDLSCFMRPTDDLPNHGGGAPPFPYVPAGLPGSVLKPGAVEFAGIFRNPEIHQAIAAVEETLP